MSKETINFAKIKDFKKDKSTELLVDYDSSYNNTPKVTKVNKKIVNLIKGDNNNKLR